MAIQIDQINPGSTAVIVIDMQNDFIAPGAPLETPMGMELMPRLQKLLGHARQTGMEVIFTAHAQRKKAQKGASTRTRIRRTTRMDAPGLRQSPAVRMK